MDERIYTVAPDVRVLENDGQHVLVNPGNLEWIKLNDNAYRLAENPQGRTLGELVARECAEREADPEKMRALFDYLLEAGLIVEAEQAARLVRVHFNVTDRCNLACPTCYFAAGDRGGTNPLTTGEALAVLDALAAGRPRSLVISGGEPFLREDIAEVLAFAGRRFDDVVILTNGCLIGEREALHVRDCGARVQVSVESPDPLVHDSIRGRGSFIATLNGIRMLVAAGIEHVEIVPTLTRRNLAHVPEVVRLANDLGVGYHFSLFMPVGRGACHAADLSVPPEDLLMCLASLLRGTFEGSDGAWGGETRSDSPVDLCVKRGCGAGHDIISVGPDGSVYPCPLMHRPDMLLGWLPGDSLSKIRRRGKNAVPDVTLLQACFRCEVAHFCGGGCRAHALAQGGSVLSPDPYCEFYRAAYRAALWGWREDRPVEENVRALVAALESGL
ncbi:MAG: radical SAM protein [Bacillota bacterium]